LLSGGIGEIVDEVSVLSRPSGIVVNLAMASGANCQECIHSAKFLSSPLFMMNLITCISADFASVVFIHQKLSSQDLILKQFLPVGLGYKSDARSFFECHSGAQRFFSFQVHY
jgi:hypothetical protein